MRIMLVDDSATMRRIQRTQLAGLGITDIVEAANGQEAVDLMPASMPVDVILLDWNMPVMDGLAFLKRLRSDSAYQNVRVVMCTSESEKKKVIEALKEGATNYMVKPFTPEVLKEKLGL